MSKVELELATYDALQHNISDKAARIDDLEQQLQTMKDAHEAEIERMTKEGKVRCISDKRHPLFPFIISDEKEYKGFDDVKSEVEEHFKQGLFNEELEKYKKEQLQDIMNQLSEKDKVIAELRSQLSRLENRSLIERICNK